MGYRLERNIMLNESALKISADIDIIQSAVERLAIDTSDELKDLNLDPSDMALVSTTSEFTDLLQMTVNSIGEADPLTLRSTLNSPNRENWIKAMRQELDSLVENATFDLDCTASSNEHTCPASPLTTKWVFRTKSGADGIR